MGHLHFSKKTKIPVPAQTVFNWYQRPHVLERVRPPWENIEIVEPGNCIEDSSKAIVRYKMGPFWTRWEFLYSGFKRNEQFCDHLVKGPFRYWSHRHLFNETKERNTLLEDSIEYIPPLGNLGKVLFDRIIQRKLKRIFRYRHEVTKRDILTYYQKPYPKNLRILIAGGSGFIGAALKTFLSTQGHDVVELSRSPKAGAFLWDPIKDYIDPKALQNVDVVINLCGYPVFTRWTPENKELIYRSRVKSTRFLSKKIAALKKPPSVFICASGINIYGTSRTERLHEESSLGDGFLAGVCHDWEAATQAVKKAGIRVVNLRMGMVLSPEGGALSKMLPAFKWFMGGRLGSGHQALSWIAMDDLLDVIYFCIVNKRIEGPLNVASPYSLTNFKFKQALARTLGRKAPVPVPAFILRAIFGDLADETMLTNLRVKPQKLQSLGFKFRYPRIERALKHILGC